ncbi:MAG: hypothetical protein V8R80_11640 [Eubacterium sp.]
MCGHVGAVNQAALDAAGFDEHTAILGGVLDKNPDGILKRNFKGGCIG